MNPFDWHGEAFLVFYVIFTLVVLLLGRAVQRAREDGPVPRLPAVDPHVIAYLRGGPDEAIRTAILSMLDRGLLRANETVLVATRSAEAVRRAIERSILDACRFPQTATSLLKEPSVREACEPLAAELRGQRLLPSAGQHAQRLLLVAAVLLVLWGAAGLKVGLALSRGRHNVVFLIFLAMMASGISFGVLLRRERTTLGDRVVADLQELFAGLRTRAHDLPSGGASNEVALLLGVFGMNALAGNEHARAAVLFPRAAFSGRDGSSSCGSSCGSSSCGGGGGCGGGGCGGCGG